MLIGIEAYTEGMQDMDEKDIHGSHAIESVRPHGKISKCLVLAFAASAIFAAGGFFHDYIPGISRLKSQPSVRVTATYPIDFERDDCADKVYVDDRTIYVQSHSVHGIRRTAGFKDPVPVFTAGHRIEDLVVSHYNRDGNLDIRVYGPDSSCIGGKAWRSHILYGNGDGTFRPETLGCMSKKAFYFDAYIIKE